MSGRLHDKIAFITGACSGIGLGTVELFIAEGARVLAADIQDELGAQLEARFKGALIYRHCDVTEPEQIRSAIDQAAGEFGGLDIVFNNAGAGGERGGIEELTLEGWDRTHALLLRSVVAGTKFALPHLKARGGGSIINTSSVSALGTGYAPLAYSAAKAAVLHFCKLAAADLARYKVRVNAVVPGFIATPIFGSSLGMNAAGAQVAAKLIAEPGGAMQPAGRAGLPADIAESVLYFASDASSFVTGASLLVDGGLTLGTRASWDPSVPSPMLSMLGISAEQAQAMLSR